MFEKIKPLFKEAETPFGAPQISVKPENSSAVLYGVPLDVSASFGKGTSNGPAAMRKVSADLLELYLMDCGTNYIEKVPICDLGDFLLSGKKESQLEQIKKLEQVNSEIRASGKIPIILGGEHTMSMYTIAGVMKEKPLVLHFDAHRDMKPIYLGESICHTTPFYHLLLNLPPADLVQIGVRQADEEEDKFAKKSGVITVSAADLYGDFNSANAKILQKAAGRKIYVSFDIDCLDSCYTPATGTPVSFGMTPWQVLEIIRGVNERAKELIGVEIVEVGQDANFREAELATQILIRTLASCVK